MSEFGRIGHSHLPRTQRVGGLTLDLFHRDASAGGRWLRLHPREFEVLWSLADARGKALTKKMLLTNVWRIAHIPQSNRVEVTISRIRSKLHSAQLAWMIVTEPEGGYRLVCAGDAPKAKIEADQDEALDSFLRIGNDGQARN
ncbi:winged helix-turn-helix domain-containing protein [Pontixanthobacter gangjinensis]|uniref:winged helix-turn-helix domain-containing protein n=1 Tax=Pontixanthobacter gangjinensis TaxID=1028742 RepID=UPI002E257076